MPRKEILDRVQKYVHPFRITKGKGFRLKDFDPGDTCGLRLDKGEAAELLQRGIAWLAEEQEWSDYMHAFEEAIRATASKHAP